MPKLREQQKQAQQHRRIADARDDECLASRQAVRRIAIPESDQEIAAQAHALPSEIQQEQIVGEQQREHRGDEQVHVGKESAVALVLPHELSRVEMNPKADEGDHQDHHQGQRVQIESDVRLEAGDADPCPEELGVGMAGRR